MKKLMKSKELLKKVFMLLDEKSAEDIVAFQIEKVSSLADFIVICTGNSDIHIKALVDHLTETLKGDSIRALSIDGYGLSKWVCIDYGEILINVMGKNERDYYSLENIWGGCDKLLVEDVLKKS
jgi:ribosome-associated protein